MKLGAPVVLTAVQNLAVDAPNTLFDISRLSAPHLEPLWISEIRFYTGLPAGLNIETNGFNSQGYINLGLELHATIHVGQMLLAEDVPVWSLAPVVDRQMESIQGLLGCFRWRFMRPMFLPPGMGFRVAMRRELVKGALSTYSTNPIPTWCSIVGQVALGDFPRTMVVPYADTYNPGPVAGPSTGQFTATQQDLLNATGSDIELRYAVGRLALVYPIAPANVAPGPLAETWDVQDAGIEVSAPCTLQINSDSIIPQNTQFNAAFDYARRAMRLGGAVLRQGDRAMFSMKYPVGLPVDWANPGTYYWAPNVTIVGSRKEDVP